MADEIQLVPIRNAERQVWYIRYETGPNHGYAVRRNELLEYGVNYDDLNITYTVPAGVVITPLETTIAALVERLRAVLKEKRD